MMIIYRTNFQKALKNYIESYGEELIASENLQKAFIRKMDDLCQIKRIFYFAYGSNVKDHLRSRIGPFHEFSKGYIKNYSLKFNKKSVDGSSKANIIFEKNSVV